MSAEALARLETDSCVVGDVAEVSLTQGQFDELWRSGLFQALNSRLGILIDDYEDARVPTESLSVALSIYEEIASEIGLEAELKGKIRRLLEVARANQTGVFFYF